VKLIVGLGNPGAEYTGTRHNLGFEVVDELARRWQLRLRSWKAIAALVSASDRGVILGEPATYVNLSGEAVERIATFYRVPPGDMLVVADDVNLPLGRLRLRRSGSAGGHNGLKSIIQHVGAEFPRLRIGVGRGDPAWDLADHVLSPFGPDEREVVAQAVFRAADAAELFVERGIDAAMSRFNPSEDRENGQAEEREKEDGPQR
jgi:peptidyl-tRNA hydrolase, PTH1 family